MSYTLKTNPNGYKQLQINGRDCICPFRMPQFMPVDTGEKDLVTGEAKVKTARISEICGNACPLFEILQGEIAVALHCGAGTREILLTKAQLAQA